MKLHAGISAPDDTAGTGERSAEYDIDGNIEVTIGEAAAVDLTEDKDATVAANYGWEGKKYTASPTGGGMYEAVVYSNVGDPTKDEKFNVQYPLATADTATATVKAGEVAINTASADTPASRVASTSFDQSAGSKMFDLPANMARVIVAGMYHGVPGNYYCTPSSATAKCTSTVAVSGFTLTGGTLDVQAHQRGGPGLGDG